LVEAGRRLLEREGSAGLSLRAVAREAGVSAAAPYHHFKDRAALLYAVAHEGNVALNDVVRTAFDSTGPGQERIVAVGLAYVTFALANPALYELMFETTRLYDTVPDSSEAEGQLPRLLAATFGASLPARKADLDRHLAVIAGWSMFRGLAEVARFRTMEPFKTLLGGETEFLKAVLARLDLSLKLEQP
jgi:AcrR family transcriptional regulator